MCCRGWRLSHISPSQGMRVKADIWVCYNDNACTNLHRGGSMHISESLWILIPVLLHCFREIEKPDKSLNECRSEGGYSDGLCWERVTGWHLSSSQPIHLNDVLQLTLTKASFFKKNLNLSNKTRFELSKRIKKMKWCDEVNVTPSSWHSVCWRMEM